MDTDPIVAQQQRALNFLIGRLTPREREIVRLLAAGVSPADIKDRLPQSPKKAIWSIRKTMVKLGVQTPNQVVPLLAASGLDGRHLR